MPIRISIRVVHGDSRRGVLNWGLGIGVGSSDQVAVRNLTLEQGLDLASVHCGGHDPSGEMANPKRVSLTTKLLARLQDYLSDEVAWRTLPQALTTVQATLPGFTATQTGGLWRERYESQVAGRSSNFRSHGVQLSQSKSYISGRRSR